MKPSRMRKDGEHPDAVRRRRGRRALAVALLLGGLPGAAPAQIDVARLAPPPGERPVMVDARFVLHDINEISDSAETFEFTGVLTLTWRDPREAFDPAAVGVAEKVYQGPYQFDEIGTGWYPQVVLINQSGAFQVDGVTLRVRPDGTSTLIQAVNAVAEIDFSTYRYPFDRQRLEAVFEVLGFGRDEVRLRVAPAAADALAEPVIVPQWKVAGATATVRDRAAFYAGGTASALVVGIDVARDPFFINRLVLFPLVVIVLLSFSVFWMDRSSLGDRLSVSFIGILTGVAYQMVVSDAMPRIAHVTLMHGILNASFLAMCATVVINLVVGSLDKRGQQRRGDRIDALCRWIFPLVYFGWIGGMIVVAMAFF